MKKSFAFGAIAIVTAFGISYSSALKGYPQGDRSQPMDDGLAEAQVDQKILHCVETDTFVDGPGNEYLLSLGKNFSNAFVNSRPVAGLGGAVAQWRIESAQNSVKLTDDDRIFVRQLTDPIDWSKTDLCYKFVKETIFVLEQSNEGQYTGFVTQDAFIKRDPSVMECSPPFPQPARPKEVLCTLY